MNARVSRVFLYASFLIGATSPFLTGCSPTHSSPEAVKADAKKPLTYDPSLTRRVTVDETSLSAEDASYTFDQEPVAACGEPRVAYIGGRRDGNVYLVADGKAGGGYKHIWGIEFSADAKHLAYVAKEGTGQAECLVLDGAKRIEPEGFVTYRYLNQARDPNFLMHSSVSWPVIFPEKVVHFSPDGEHLAYAAVRGSGRMVVLDNDHEAHVYDQVGAPVFSADNRHLAYIAQKSGKHIVVVDRAEGPEYDGIWHLMFSPVGNHHAYAARNGSKKVVVVDGKEGPEFDLAKDEYQLVLRFSGDGQHVGYEAARGSSLVAVIDGQEAAVQNVLAGSLVFSGDGKRSAYEANRDGRRLIIVDAKIVGEYDPSSAKKTFDEEEVLAKSHDDNRTYAEYVIQAGQITKKAFGGEEVLSELYDDDGARARSPVAYVLKRGRAVNVAWCDKLGTGVQPAEFHREVRMQSRLVRLGLPSAFQNGHPAMPRLVFSSDGAHFAFVAMRHNTQFVVLDGQEGKPFDEIGEDSLSFSRERNQMVYKGRRGTGWMLIVDGRESEPVDLIATCGPEFSRNDGRVVVGACRNGRWGVVVNDRFFSTKADSPTERDISKLGTFRPGGGFVTTRVKTQLVGLALSPDGRHVARVLDNGENYDVIVDAVSSDEFVQKGGTRRTPYYGGYFAGSLQFTTSDSLHFLGLENGAFVHVTLNLSME